MTNAQVIWIGHEATYAVEGDGQVHHQPRTSRLARGGTCHGIGLAEAAWEAAAEPAGYRLKAMILEWPNGFPGDVGLFVAWR